MFANVMKRCAAGPHVTARDNKIAAAVMLGVTLVFSLVYLALARAYRGNELVDAFGVMLFPAAMLLSMPFNYMKGHSRASQVVIIGGCLVVLAAISFLATLI